MNVRSLSQVRSLDRRAGGVEKAGAPRSRTLFVFRETGDTDETVAARIRAMIANGVASAHDRIIPFAWVDPQSEEGRKAHHDSADHDSADHDSSDRDSADHESIDPERVET